MVTADYLLGRRFRWTAVEAPDVTVVAVDPQAGTCRVHALDRGRHALPLADVIAAVEAGLLEESATGAPFVWGDPMEHAYPAPCPTRQGARLVVPVRRNGRTISVDAAEYARRMS